MSRTIRCKNMKPPESYLISREEYEDFILNPHPRRYWMRWGGLIKDSFEKTRRAELSKAHSDHGLTYFFCDRVPSHFRRDLNSWRRVIAKQELQISVLKDFGESYLPYRPRDIKDLHWFWD